MTTMEMPGRHALDHPRFVTNGGQDAVYQFGETEISAWADIEHIDQDKPVGGVLTAYTRDGHERVGELRYYFITAERDEIQFQDVTVEPQFRRRRVATALLRKLNLIHPEARINPGTRTVGGEAFFQHIMATEKEKVATNGILNVPLQVQIPPGFRPGDALRAGGWER
ncbi:hypothetical protein PBI_SEBATA_121 [Mycobacterium phage Sebata]|uniref:Uncharacterized protein n=2 Tax=Bixzunavirus TaxID=680114 RepID=G1JXL1_9CAUD|nr:hypothetical protein LINSTU_119 [Mycobacterium phage LinStu]YP_009608801.1 hypothetical protein FDI20_gp198 [Mycobacterium phage Sebata]AEK06593.1 hypothetical protein PBI_SEBATA_121 [Mycobacterium phage Sebata]AEL98356.1 hypothetical protein LINSTU_119 [Mycobacterium phage LinStu]